MNQENGDCLSDFTTDKIKEPSFDFHLVEIFEVRVFVLRVRHYK